MQAVRPPPRITITTAITTGRRQPEEIKLDLTPVVVAPYVVPAVTNDPVRASFLKRMNLENGVEVRSTRWIEPGDVTTRNLFILSVTQSLEGGFDSVNMYDKGVLSWGVMQWTAATDSLPPVLVYIKRRLMQTGQARVWDKVFVRAGAGRRRARADCVRQATRDARRHAAGVPGVGDSRQL